MFGSGASQSDDRSGLVASYDAFMMARTLVLLGVLIHFATADTLLLCGADEVFRIDPAVETSTKLWSWRAKDCKEIPAALKGGFGTTDECKPIDGGKRLLIASSGGGCALLEYPSGKALWWARVPNAHSIEALRGGRVAVASSVGQGGNKVVIFDTAQVDLPIAELDLPSAHGLVWDQARNSLWALGFKELIRCELPLVEGKMLPRIHSRHALPDDDGHDLRAVPGSSDLLLSTDRGVWRFNRDTGKFRADPKLADWAKLKSIDINPNDGRLAVVRAEGGNWWSDSIRFLEPVGVLRLKGECLYKARWIQVAD